ncbi:MAG: Ig-like domain repeat protein, partial [Verrucomicrobiota bacterium]
SDGVRLWINGVQVINDWNDQTTSVWNDSAPITLIAGQKYCLKMEYYDNSDPATARLYWYMPSREAAAIIPQELFFPVTGVVLTLPSNITSFAPGASVTLTADVTDVAGTVTSVSFYNGASLIGSATTAPYSVNWTNMATGEYALTAKATTSTAAVSTSTAVVVTVGGNTVPVTSGLACWFDASYGVTTDASSQVRVWHDRSGNGHHGAYREHYNPSLVTNQLFSRPAVRFIGDCRFDVGGSFFVKEQYVVVRSPSSTWSGTGAFLGRRLGRASSYMLDGSLTTGFYADQLPAAVSKNGAPIALNQQGNVGFNLGTITDYMLLKITVNDNDTRATNYMIGGIDQDAGWKCKFDVAEILGYARTLTSQEEAQVGGYLTAKYGLATAYPATGSLANRAATGITNSTAAINATLMCNGSNYDVTAFWGPEDGGINPANWANSATIGSWTHVASMDINRTLTNLASATTYYFTFRATNGTNTIWASPAQSFATLSTAKDLLTFGDNVTGSSAVIDTAAATVAWSLPYGTGLTSLAPTCTDSLLASVSPVSGTRLNFTTPQTYIITAQDGSTKTYTVTASVGAASSACDILTFGPGATIVGNSISLTVPYETDLTTFAPAYTVSTGASGIPASGVAPNFANANPATYTITGQNGTTTKTYYVTLTVLPLNPDRISNGSFETGKYIADGGATAVSLPGTDLPGWSGNFTSWYFNRWNGVTAPDGTRYVNLCYGTGANVISQAFAVTAGTVYTVSYYERIRGNGYMDCTLSVAAGTVSGAVGSPVAVSVGPAASIVQTSAVNPAWTHHSFKFTPNSTTTATISFGNHYDGTGGDNDGVLLDNVSVTAAVIGGSTPSTATLTRHLGTGTSSPYGSALSFDVIVAGSSGTPTGTVTLKDGGSSGTTLGSASLTNGACTITTFTLALGTHSNIVAVYGGNSTYTGSTSSPLSQTVISNPPDTTSGLTATPGASGAVMLTWNTAAGATGYKISITNTATSAEQLVTVTASPYTVTGLTNGTSYQFKVLGTNSVGDGPYSSVVSAMPSFPATTTTLTSSLGATGTYGTAVTFTATVAVTGGPATGTVTFLDGATQLGSGTLNASGQATFTSSTLAVGAHSISASYPGNTSFGASATTVLSYTLTAMPLTLTGVVASNKDYDGTTAAVLTSGALSAGVVNGETVTVTVGSGNFASANAGTWPVTASGYALGGANAGNYVLSGQPPLPNATITARPLQLTGTRIYDGTTAAAAGVLAISNKVSGDDLGLTGSATLTAKNVGSQGLALASIVAPAIVQNKSGSLTGGASATSFNVTALATAPTVGNTLIAVIATGNTSQNSVVSIGASSGTALNWQRAAQSTVVPNGTTTEVWYAPVLAGAGSTVTINLAGTGYAAAAVVAEYRGVLTTSSVDQIAGNSGSSSTNPASTGTTPATIQANDLAIGGFGLIYNSNGTFSVIGGGSQISANV